LTQPANVTDPETKSKPKQAVQKWQSGVVLLLKERLTPPKKAKYTKNKK
jgi:hypothetical protein